jgi:alpha,alpha-trehalose phosphorylase
MEGAFRIDGVTGPDEYSAVSDNNLFTNLMAQHNLVKAAEVVGRYPNEARDLQVTSEEAADWKDAASAVVVNFDSRLGVHPQSEGFTDHAPWDFASTSSDQYPLLLYFPYFDLYRKQVVKQSDLILAMHLRHEAFTAEQKARNFSYYESITVRDSSLSACTQAVIAAEVGLLELAHDYLAETALMDLGDLEHNTRDGVHMASLGGIWIALVMGFGGMRAREGFLSFAPRLPGELDRIIFRVRYRGRRIRVNVEEYQAAYELLDGSPIEIGHHDTHFVLGPEPVLHPIPAIVAPPSPRQPPGREPIRRRTSRPS